MAEFCLDCWNKINGTNDPKSRYILSDELDLCEECGQWTHVIVTVRKGYLLRRIRCEIEIALEKCKELF